MFTCSWNVCAINMPVFMLFHCWTTVAVACIEWKWTKWTNRALREFFFLTKFNFIFCFAFFRCCCCFSFIHDEMISWTRDRTSLSLLPMSWLAATKLKQFFFLSVCCCFHFTLSLTSLSLGLILKETQNVRKWQFPSTFMAPKRAKSCQVDVVVVFALECCVFSLHKHRAQLEKQEGVIFCSFLLLASSRLLSTMQFNFEVLYVQTMAMVMADNDGNTKASSVFFCKYLFF